ncbi:LacI family DNA-binding transcriptional regulator [Salinibacterium sp. SWN1162]|uniref:LacI family DNA-binding transcriptional regulator n=1 Tax=Salinibacterium sp. SWN1162 TaxID=2792053 RepID=UPI0018CDE7DD|nr:LacI family DNA-binding transcriptional regulator [Salinibacterium sp. SWN1162]MBH0007720.1 LacI family DNA-binding transcriptional regulator [Salinibacterium sp. SWN1162]
MYGNTHHQFRLNEENGGGTVATNRPERVTQRMIAELAGVSQATVSLVLNGKTDSTTRIPDETRERVLQVIRDTTYVADPAARRLAGVGNSLIGIFTYEHAFPHESSDFYTPLLTGIEGAAEQIGVDLLMFTSAPVVQGRRRLFHENNRLRLADGCLLLGREMDADELTRLVDSNYPFVAIGRRDAADGRIPYVGVDYAAATARLARLAIESGHEQFYYLHLSYDAESTRDRKEGLNSELTAAGFTVDTAVTDGSDLAAAWQRIRSARPTVLFVEDAGHAEALRDLAVADGVSVPAELSIIALGERTRPSGHAVDFTRLSAPREELGSRAVALLDHIMNGTGDSTELPHQQLVSCTVIAGTTLAAPRVGSI